MMTFSNLHRRAAALALIGLTAFGALAFQPSPTLAQDKADVSFIAVPLSGFDFRLSPDGHTAAAFALGVLADGWKTTPEALPIYLYDVTTGKALRTLDGATDYTNAISFSGDGTQLASAHQNGDLNLWNVATGKLTKSFDTGVLGGARLQFIPRGRTVALGIYDPLRPHALLFDAQTGSVTAMLVPHINSYADVFDQLGSGNQNTTDALAASADGRTLAMSTATGEVWLWDVATRKGTLLAKTDQNLSMFNIRKLAFTADSKKLVYFNDLKTDGKIHVWTLADSTESVAAVGGRAWALAPDGDTVAWATKDDTTVHVAKISAPDDVTELDLGTAVTPQPTLEFTKDGKHLVIGLWHPQNAEDGTNGLYVLTLP